MRECLGTVILAAGTGPKIDETPHLRGFAEVRPRGLEPPRAITARKASPSPGGLARLPSSACSRRAGSCETPESDETSATCGGDLDSWAWFSG